MRAMGYSLWFVPQNEAYQRLRPIIHRLSEEYSTPDFEPHVTLIGPVYGPETEVIQKLSHLASLIRSFEVKLTHADYLDEYFKCLFIRVEETKNVMDANRMAREAFGMDTNAKYMPHLSLVYGQLAPETKEDIMKDIGRNFGMNFIANSIQLVLTEGKTSSWKTVKEFSLE